MSKLKKKPIILFIIALVALYVIIYIIPTVTGALVSSYTIEYGELKLFDETTGYLVRDEKVYTAGTGGKSNPYIKDGTLVRRGTTVMEVTGASDRAADAKYSDMLGRLGKDAVATDSFSTEDVGIVSYYADGYESKLTPKTMKKGNYSYYSKLSQDNVKSLDRKNIAKGEPVFKVVDRTRWYIVCFVDAEHMDRYEKGETVTVEFEDDFVEAEIRSVSKDPDKEAGKARVILSTYNYYEKYAQMRVAPVSLVTYEQRGLLVENDSITEEKGRPGVYVKNKNKDFVFVPVQVMATDGTYSLVADTLFIDEKDGKQYATVEIYDEVLKNPK